MLAIVYQRLGQSDKAYDIWKATYLPNLRPPFDTLAECPQCVNPYFATCAGSVLEALIYGFGGIDISDRGFIQRLIASLPQGWKSLTMTSIGPRARTFAVRAS